MKLSEFSFVIPEELIAQRPLQNRSDSRMMVVHRKSGKIEHRSFLDLSEYLRDSDTLVFNRSKVIKSRLVGRRETGGKVEIFLTKKISDFRFECLVRATAAKKIGLQVAFDNGLLATVVSETTDPMVFIVEFLSKTGDLNADIEAVGKVPLPPYIQREADDPDLTRYQTVYAEVPGSVAAPTAGLHFTPEVLAAMQKRGIGIEYVTLHVGLGTFLPIKVENISEHKMHSEFFSVPDALRKKCVEAKLRQERIVAIGTTSVRSLESAARGYQESTDLFLQPGMDFHWVDALFTNFHQPESTLVVMLSAFMGSRELVLEAYQSAVEKKYRFFSYGDCMLVL